MNNLIAITIGDINGIGIEIIINSWKTKKINNFILLTDINKFKRYIKKKKFKIDFNIVNKNRLKIKYIKNNLNIYHYNSTSNEDNTFKSLKYAYDLCKYNICIGIITLPLRKDLIKEKINTKFIGHTEYFQYLDNKKHSNMILYHKKIIISPLTTHIQINKISKLLADNNFILNQLININNSLKYDFNIKKPKLIISGFNPHSGENGKIGNEEIKFIIPILKQLRKRGVLIDGPYSGDSLLIKKNLKIYNCFIYIFHDQALIPFKYISQFSGVNYTGNLSIIRTSPDHGTAYNLIGNKNVSNNSILNCFKFIKKIHRNRKSNVKT